MVIVGLFGLFEIGWEFMEGGGFGGEDGSDLLWGVEDGCDEFGGVVGEFGEVVGWDGDIVGCEGLKWFNIIEWIVSDDLVMIWIYE